MRYTESLPSASESELTILNALLLSRLLLRVELPVLRDTKLSWENVRGRVLRAAVLGARDDENDDARELRDSTSSTEYTPLLSRKSAPRSAELPADDFMYTENALLSLCTAVLRRSPSVPDSIDAAPSVDRKSPIDSADPYVVDSTEKFVSVSNRDADEPVETKLIPSSSRLSGSLLERSEPVSRGSAGDGGSGPFSRNAAVPRRTESSNRPPVAVVRLPAAPATPTTDRSCADVSCSLMNVPAF